jgi:hypothetical protein
VRTRLGIEVVAHHAVARKLSISCGAWIQNVRDVVRHVGGLGGLAPRVCSKERHMAAQNMGAMETPTSVLLHAWPVANAYREGMARHQSVFSAC